MSRSQLLPGKTTTPIRTGISALPDAGADDADDAAPSGSTEKTSMSGFDSSSAASRSTTARAAASSAASTVSSARRPIRTSWIALDPEVAEAALDRPPGGIEDAGLGRDVDREPEARHGAITSSSR